MRTGMWMIWGLALGVAWAQPAARDLQIDSARAVLTAARQERRVALIIGNDAYPESPLQNAVNDARAIDKAVTEIGQKFETIVLENASLKEMQRAVTMFVERLQENDVAMIYYAGHGVQLGDENYLVPVDFAAEDAAAARFAAYNANELLDRVGAKKPKLLMVMLDACRNNPFKVTRAMGTGGLAPVGASVKGSIIVLSTAPGKTASDNPTGKNTYFNMAVVENIGKKGLDVNEMFNEVKRSVSGMSRDEQRPWTNSDYAGRWYFHPPDDFLPSDIDPAVSERLYKDAQAASVREDYRGAEQLFGQVVARETDSPMGVAATAEREYMRALEALQGEPAAEASAGRAERLENLWRLQPYRGAGYGLEAAAQRLALGNLAGGVTLLGRLRASASEETAFRARKMLTALAPVSPEAKETLTKAVIPETAPVAAVLPESRFRKIAEELAQEARRKAEEQARKEAEAKAAGEVTAGDPAAATAGGRRIQIVTLELSEPLAAAAAVEVEPVAVAGKKPSSRLPLLHLTTTPAGAVVTFGEAGMSSCTSPCETRVAAGRYTASISMAGYRTELRILNVAMPGLEEEVELPLKQGKVLLACEGNALPLALDGRPMAGQCPGEVSLPPGQYELTLWDGSIRLERVRVQVVDNGLEKAHFANR